MSSEPGRGRTTRRRLYIREDRHNDEPIRPLSTARRRMSGSAHSFVVVTFPTLSGPLTAAQDPVSLNETPVQDMDSRATGEVGVS